MFETQISQMCALKGILVNGTSFIPIDEEYIESEMVKSGLRYNGEHRLYNGITGEYFDASIFMGVTQIQRLPKFVIDDQQAVGMHTSIDQLTGQPRGGKAIQGGLKIGEMEGTVMDSQGAMFTVYEKLHEDSDGRSVQICKNCGKYAIYNEYHNIYKCLRCQENADIVTVDTRKSVVLFHNELEAAGINLKFSVTPQAFEQN